MSAVPKKKLCWHCEGNIDLSADNCPFCGVYIHTPEQDDSTSWNPQFTLKVLSKKDNLEELKNVEDSSGVASQEENLQDSLQTQGLPLQMIKTEVLPMLLLFSGSCFFLFGSVLLLFSQNGTLTLQWKSEYAIYFLLLGLPSLLFGFYTLNSKE